MLKAQVLEPAPATYQERHASSSLLRSSLLSMLALSAMGMMAYNLVPIAEPWGVPHGRRRGGRPPARISILGEWR